ncbi:MAG: ATP-binding protein [Haloquadratum sp.]
MTGTDYRARLYDIFAVSDRDFEAKVTRALDLGSEYLELPIGFLTRIDDGVQEIVLSTGDHPAISPGETCPLEEAYCRRTVEIDTPLAVQDADASAEYERRLDEREAELDERQEIYRAVIDASFDLVFRIDADGELTFVSSPVESLLGYGPDEYVGQSFEQMLPDGETIDLATEMFERVMAGQPVEEYYFPLTHRAGGRVLVDVRLVPIYDPDVPRDDRTPADVVGAQGMARSASERRQREQVIQVLNRVLRHNLRNDMNVIAGTAEILREEAPEADADLVARIAEKSEHLIDLSEKARRLEQTLSTSPDPHHQDVVPLVRQAVAGIREEYPRAELRVSAPETLLAWASPDLRTALRELLENAATHAGDQPTITLACEADDQQAVIRVADDGPGLPAQERSVLESGEETPLVHSSGLGLWLVYWIVERLDGELDVREAAEGTSIEIRLRRGTEGDERPRP